MPDKVDFSKLLSVVALAVEKAIEDTAFQVQEDARNMVPYDTGTLHDSIMIQKVGNNAFEISANTEYAYYVHEGFVRADGSYQAGTPFLTQPLQQNAEKLDKRIAELMPKKVKL